MPFRNTPLVNNQYYHVFNRGVASQPTFINKKDYQRFLSSINYYRFNNIPFRYSRLTQISIEERKQIISQLEKANNLAIELVAFCLLPNHFHFLIMQKTDNGITNFMKKLAGSYTLYFNTKYQRVGPLFQGTFKSVRIETDEQLIHLSRYIHLNPITSFIIKDEKLLNYPWSSLKDYFSNNSQLLNSHIVLDNFKNFKDYYNFIIDHADYAKKISELKHITLDNTRVINQ